MEEFGSGRIEREGENRRKRGKFRRMEGELEELREGNRIQIQSSANILYFFSLFIGCYIPFS